MTIQLQQQQQLQLIKLIFFVKVKSETYDIII